MRSRVLSGALNLVVVLLLALPLVSSTGHSKGKPGEGGIRVNVQFMDGFVGNNSVGAKVTSDHDPEEGDLYRDGIGGVSAWINSDVSEDLLFDPNGKLTPGEQRKGLGRSLHFVLDKPVYPDQELLEAVLDDGTFLNVDGLGDVIEGLPAIRSAQFNTPLGILRFDLGDQNTGQVRISRNDTDNTWTVTTDTSVPNGDVAILFDVQSNTVQVLGYFHVPFQIIVTQLN